MKDDVNGYFEYEGSTYGVIGRIQMRIDHRWVEGVLYSKDGELFSRPKKDFLKMFKKIGKSDGRYKSPH